MDVCTSFEQGVNSGITPILLPKNQLAFALNCTVRGGNVTSRPPVNRQILAFPDAAMQTAVLGGFFQGSQVYRPDFGPTQIIASISGRLFAFTPTADDWTVTEISIPGDLNDPTAPQVWMWQSEKWLIIQDGTGKLPIFYDGVSSRRSRGASFLMGTTNAGFTVPPIGDLLTVTLLATWDYGINIPVIMNGAFYEVVSNETVPPLSAYFATLTTFYNAIPTVGIGSTVWPISVNQSKIGLIESITTSTFAPGIFPTFTAVLTSVENLALGDLCDFTPSIKKSFTNQSAQFTVLSINPTTREVSFQSTVSFGIGFTSAAVGMLVTLPNGNQTNFQVANVLTNTAIPAIGASMVVPISQLYTGTPGQVVWATDTLAFKIESFVPPPSLPTLTLTLVNLTDTGPDPAVGQQILSVPELPAGRMGAYGMGRNWLSLIDGTSYVAGDIVGGAAGSAANNFRDAVLCMTENDFLSGGGYFRLPGTGNVINSMTFTANLDASQGQGPLMIGTDSGIFSNNTPTDRDTWANLTNPILTQALIGFGPLAQNSTVVANSDILFRNIEGLGSLRIARRGFAAGDWGNTPISREMDVIFRADNPNLLIFSSGVVFDNRLLMTVSPTPNGSGTFHRGAVALNFDTVSSINSKLPPVYDGLWTGLNILQFMAGNFSGTGRSFAFSYDLTTNQIELYELLTTIGRQYFDNHETRIIWSFETPVMFNRDVKPMSELVRLLDGEMYVQEVVGDVHIKVEYRPDFYPCWVLWKEFDICADTTIPDGKPGYRTRLSMGDPPNDSCDEANDNRLLRVGHFFQFRFTFTGHLKFMGFRPQVCTEPAADFAPPVCVPTCLDEIPLPT